MTRYLTLTNDFDKFDSVGDCTFFKDIFKYLKNIYINIVCMFSEQEPEQRQVQQFQLSTIHLQVSSRCTREQSPSRVRNTMKITSPASALFSPFMEVLIK